MIVIVLVFAVSFFLLHRLSGSQKSSEQLEGQKVSEKTVVFNLFVSLIAALVAMAMIYGSVPSSTTYDEVAILPQIYSITEDTEHTGNVLAGDSSRTITRNYVRGYREQGDGSFTSFSIPKEMVEVKVGERPDAVMVVATIANQPAKNWKDLQWGLPGDSWVLGYTIYLPE